MLASGSPYNHKTLMLAEIQIDEYRHREAQVDTRQRERDKDRTTREGLLGNKDGNCNNKE